MSRAQFRVLCRNLTETLFEDLVQLINLNPPHRFIFSQASYKHDTDVLIPLLR